MIVTGGAVILVGALILWRVGMIAAAANRRAAARQALALLAALAAVFAPVALFGGSSTSVGLCLGFAIGLGICSLESHARSALAREAWPFWAPAADCWR